MATTPDAGDLDLAGSPRSEPTRSADAARAETMHRADPAWSALRPGPPRRAPLPLAAVVAAGWAGVVSFAPVLALAVLARLGTGADPLGVARFAAAGWLLAHGVPIRVDGAGVSLTPLLVTGLALWRLVRAGVHASRAVSAHRSRSLRAAFVAGTAVGLAYAGLGAVVAVWVDVSPGRAALTLGLLGSGAATIGALSYSRAGRVLLRRAPTVVRDGLRTGVSAAALVLGVGAAAAGAALAVRGGDATAMLASYRAGVLGQAGITVLCLAYAPNLAIWAAAYLLGPGFALGVGTVVSPGLVAVGPVPSVPVFAGLPVSAVPAPGSALLGIPLVAAMAAGVLCARRRMTAGWAGLLSGAAMAGPVAGLLLALAARASAGALGSDRLSVVGPSPWGVGLWGTLVVAVGAVVGAVSVRALHRSDSAGAAPVRVDG